MNRNLFKVCIFSVKQDDLFLFGTDLGGVNIVQKLVYAQIRENERAPTYTPPIRVFENLGLVDQKVYRVIDEEKVFEIGIYRLNPNFWHIFGDTSQHRKLFGAYLVSDQHHPELKKLFIRAVTEDPPDLTYQDTIMHEVLLTKFHNNRCYGIFDIDGRGIRVRKMDNKECIRKLGCILNDIIGVYLMEDKRGIRIFKKEAKSLNKKLDKIQENYIKLFEEHKEWQRIIIHPMDPDYFAKTLKRKEVEEKLFHAPLF